MRYDPAQVYPWAGLMVRMRARACVISQITGLSSTDTRNLWRDIAGSSSPSGQQPNDLMWYLRTPQNRSHAALLVRMYNTSARVLPAYAAYAHAFYHYGRISASPEQRLSWMRSGDPAFRESERDYVIPFSRGYFLAMSYTDEKLHNGRRKCELEVRRCRKCQGQYMAHVSEAGHICPVCTRDAVEN